MNAFSAMPSIAGIPNRDRSARARFPQLLLRPVVPLLGALPIHSWLGGAPHMPAEIPWPMAGGKPALFLAQISCAHLHPRLWGKRGPRTGWLLAFTPQDSPGAPILRHVLHFGTERQPPEPVHYPTIPPMRTDILAQATGAPAGIPRWPIEITVDDAPDDPSPPVAPPDTATRTDLTDPRFQPFDWGSMMVLLDSLHCELDWQHRVVTALLDPDTPDLDTLHYLDSLARTRDHTATLRSELAQAREQNLAFCTELRDLALRGLASLTLDTTTRSDNGQPMPAPSALLANSHMRQNYFRWFDHYARRLYTDRPQDLPKPQRTLFETHWSQLAQSEHGRMGAPDNTENPGEMTVLRLPRSQLMGWSFAASGDFHVSVPIERLAENDLDIGGDPPAG